MVKLPKRCHEADTSRQKDREEPLGQARDQNLRCDSLKNLRIVNTISMISILLCIWHRAMQNLVLFESPPEGTGTIGFLLFTFIVSIGIAVLSAQKRYDEKMVIMYYLVSFIFLEESFRYFRGLDNGDLFLRNTNTVSQYLFEAYKTLLLFSLTRRADSHYLRLILYLITLSYHFWRDWRLPSSMEIVLAFMLLFVVNFGERDAKESEAREDEGFLKRSERRCSFLENIPLNHSVTGANCGLTDSDSFKDIASKTLKASSLSPSQNGIGTQKLGEPEFTFEENSSPILSNQIHQENKAKFMELKPLPDDSVQWKTNTNCQKCEFSNVSADYRSPLLDITTSKFHCDQYGESSPLELDYSVYRQEIENLALSNSYTKGILGYVSHEVNTPLNLIILLLDSLRMHVNSTLYHQFVVPASRTAKIMRYVMASMEVYCQIERGSIMPNPTLVNVQSVLNELVEIFESQIANKSIVLELAIKAGTARTVKMDRKLYELLVFNLLSNSVKYTSKGSVNVAVNTFEERGNTYLKTEIHDTGEGLTSDQVASIRGRHSPLKSPVLPSLQTTSLGMGLSLSQMLSEVLSPRHKNSLEVVSELGKGSKFMFSVLVECPNAEISSTEYRRKLSNFQKNASQEKLSKNGGGTTNDLPLKVLPVQSCPDKINLKGIPTNKIEGTSPQIGDETDEIHQNLPSPIIMRSCKSLSLITATCSRSKIIDDYSRGVSWLISPNIIHSKKTELQQESCECFDILVVDDNHFNHFAVDILLRGTNLKIRRAYDGQEAVDTLDKKCNNDQRSLLESCKMILMDINMPVMDGIQAAKALKKKMIEGSMKFIPIIMSTANSTLDADQKLDGISLFDGSLPKPLDKEKFLEVLDQAINISRTVSPKKDGNSNL